MNSKIAIVVKAAIVVIACLATYMLYNPGDQGDRLKEEIKVGDYYEMSYTLDENLEGYMSVSHFIEEYFVDLDDIVGGVEDRVEFKGEEIDCIRFTNLSDEICYVNADSGFIYKTVKGTGDDRIVKQVTDTNLDIDSVPGGDPPQVGTFVIVKHNEPPYGFTTHYEVESIDERTIYGKTTVSSLTDSVRYQVTSVDDGNIDFKVNSVELSGDRSYFLQGISLESFLEYVSKDAVKTDEKEERIETAFGIRDTTVYTYKIDLVDDGLEGSSAYKLWVGKNDVIYCVEYSYTVDYYDDEEDYLETDVGIEIYKLIGTNLFA